MAAGPRLRERLVLPAVFAWLAATAWIRPLAMPDEGRYLAVAWEMLGGTSAVPTLDGLPFFHKPPLFYWLAEAAMRVGGPSAFAGRLPSITAAALVAWAMYRLALHWVGALHARLLLVVLATTPYFYLGAQYANMDMLVAACIAGCTLAAAHALLRLQGGQRAGAALPLAWAMAALGFLAKGLIGCALPAATILLWLLALRRMRHAAQLLSPGGISVFLVIALPWPLAMQARYPDFLHYFIVEQHLQRFATAGFNNAQPWWFYLPVLFGLTLPWSLSLPLAARRGLSMRNRGPAGALRVLMVSWALVVLVFFSIPHSKLIGYALPAVPPIAWLCADALVTLRRRSPAQHVGWLACATSLALLAAVTAYGMRSPHSSRELAAVLEARRAAGEPVVFVDTYPFDLEFRLRLKPPIPIVVRWSDPSLAHNDSWQQALLDGAHFAPAAAADRLVTAIPGEGAMWIVAPLQSVLPPQLHARAVAHDRELALWKVDPPGAPAPLTASRTGE